jgi:hypothetical protein
MEPQTYLIAAFTQEGFQCIILSISSKLLLFLIYIQHIRANSSLVFSRVGCDFWKRHGLSSAGEFHRTSCPHLGDPLCDIIHACTHRLLFCREILHVVDKGQTLLTYN